MKAFSPMLFYSFTCNRVSCLADVNILTLKFVFRYKILGSNSPSYPHFLILIFRYIPLPLYLS
ncbi:hypothetical protein PHET_12127 [Paragonimus heterotremus]|uniref:Uncharacterized protein n=1 Tax=Paragonimus heterotremus TaxID=100268 RepID=A0A8J4WCB0_9TREM|nr:hypothetical protein PHET_12127 [Paragonimus heterotremus]